MALLFPSNKQTMVSTDDALNLIFLFLNLNLREEDAKETLEILGESLGAPPPAAYGPPWVPPDHPLAYIETAIRDGAHCMVRCAILYKQNRALYSSFCIVTYTT